MRRHFSGRRTKKSRVSLLEVSGVSGRGEFRVRQVAVRPKASARSETNEGCLGSTGTGGARNSSGRDARRVDRQLRICFVCARAGSRHFLVDCEKFVKLSHKDKRQVACLQTILHAIVRLGQSAESAALSVARSKRVLFMTTMNLKMSGPLKRMRLHPVGLRLNQMTRTLSKE